MHKITFKTKEKDKALEKLKSVHTEEIEIRPVKRNNILLKYNGKIKTLSGHAKEQGISRYTAFQRYNAGKPLKEVFSRKHL